MDVLIIAFVGYVVGGIGRTVYDFLWKLLDDPKAVWDQKYTITFLISTIISFISAVALFSTVQIPPDLAVSSQFSIFIITFTQGFTINHLVNKPITYLTAKAEGESTSATPTPPT